MTTIPNHSVEAFLRKLRQGIASLPLAEQDEIVAELRSHLAERQAQGSTDPLAGFESPARLAADFVGEHTLRDALARGTPWAMSSAFFVVARDSVLGLLVLFPLLVFQLEAVLLLLAAALKPLLPEQTGLWVGPGKFYVGILASPDSGRELLGWWAIPVFAITGVVLFWGANQAMMMLIRWRLRGLSSGTKAR